MEEDYGTAKWVEREDAHARQVLSTAKVVVTFSLPLAATFVVAAMQNNDKARWSEISAGLLILAVTYTIRVLRKRKSELDPTTVEKKSADIVQAALKTAALADKAVAEAAHRLMVRQVWLAALSSLAGAIALLVGVAK
jgi:hypothetical protein